MIGKKDRSEKRYGTIVMIELDVKVLKKWNMYKKPKIEESMKESYSDMDL